MLLCQGQHLAPTGRADALVMAGRVARKLVLVTQLALYLNQVLHLKLRRKRLLTTHTEGLPSLLSDIPVELDAQLRRPLEDVKELAKRQPEQRENHRHGMRDGQKLISV